MKDISLDEFMAEGDAFDAAVATAAEIDPFCCSTDWILPAWETWGSLFTPWLRRNDTGYLAFLQTDDGEGRRALLGFDTMWGFACPLVGVDAAAFAEHMRGQEWNLALVPGLTPGSPLFNGLVTAFEAQAGLGTGETLIRWVASLKGGVDGFLSRRAPKFRENVRRAERRAGDAGVVVEAGPPDFTRVISIERRSWKGPAGTGLMSNDLRRFYELIVARLGDRVRMQFARRDGIDLGYILGGVRDGCYRGLQFSFDESCAELSLGNVLQMAQIGSLCEEGVTSYDLGIDMDYKRHWADESISTVTLAILRR